MSTFGREFLTHFTFKTPIFEYKIRARERAKANDRAKRLDDNSQRSKFAGIFFEIGSDFVQYTEQKNSYQFIVFSYWLKCPFLGVLILKKHFPYGKFRFKFPLN
jgi:hypothetical protein